MTNWTPTSLLAKAVDLAGFLYDPDQDIIYSRMDALQRPLGYAYAYDVSALLMDAVIDCEPIFFTARGKLWMVEMWKGQYGLETGCEIGVYNRPVAPPPYYSFLDEAVGTRPYDPAHGYFYQSADDADMLEMAFTLKRNGEPLFSRGSGAHWWLTGFRWGVYSTPEQLTMDVAVTLPDREIHDAFTQSLAGMGYAYEDDGATVRFLFDRPYAPQPWVGAPGLAQAQQMQQAIVSTYQSFNLQSNDPNKIPPELARQIATSVTANGPPALGAVLISGLRAIGRSASEIGTLIGVDLQVAADTVAAWITTAGYDLVQWVHAVYAAVSEMFTMNFSSAIEVHNTLSGNNLPSDLYLQAHSEEEGAFLVPPPQTIPAGTVGRFYLKDKLGPYGSKGSATYSYEDNEGRPRTVTFTFGCPTGFSNNYAHCDQPAFAIYAKSGDKSRWGGPGAVPGGGHPLYVAYVWGPGPAPV